VIPASCGEESLNWLCRAGHRRPRNIVRATMMTIIAAITSSTSLVNVMGGHYKPVLRSIGVKFPYRAESVTKMRLGGAAIGGSARTGDFRICANRTIGGPCRTGGRRSAGGSRRWPSGAGSRGSRQPDQKPRPVSDEARGMATGAANGSNGERCAGSSGPRLPRTIG
jgi:hypothetical protein